MKNFSKINKKQTCLSDSGLDSNSELASSLATTLGIDRCCRALEILKSMEVAALELGSKGQRDQSGLGSRRGGGDD
ncbi:hypothetical protein ACFX2I_046524 [Malus domestica]